MSTSKNLKSKNMMYTQQISYLPAGTPENLSDIIEKKLKPRKYALIVHDKDIDENGNPEAVHIHVMFTFDNARSCSNVAKILGDKPQYLKAWRRNDGNGYSYLIHAAEKAKSKYQYDPNQVTANFDYIGKLTKIKSEVADSTQHTKINNLLDDILKGKIGKEEAEAQLSGFQYARYHRQIDDVSNKRLEIQAKEWMDEMKAQGKKIEVIWISGGAGVGKTSLAREYAQKLERDYFVSGSSRDIFQKYKGEHTIILDELRPDVIPYQDLLRMTDPFGLGTQVMAPARYNDKALACDLFIITSPYDPYFFYNKIFGFNSSTLNTDSFEQLQRRISLTIEMQPDYIYATEYVAQRGYQVIPETARENRYSSSNYPPQTANAITLFNSMFEPTVGLQGMPEEPENI